MKWMTEKGNEIELIVGEAQIDKTADGTIYAEETYKTIEKFVAAGTEYSADFTKDKGQDVIKFFINNKEMIVIIPENIVDRIWGTERAARKEAAAKSFELEQEYERNYNKIINTVNQ